MNNMRPSAYYEEHEFDSSHITREYLRTYQMLGASGEIPNDFLCIPLTIDEVLYAHYLIADHFFKKGNGMGGIGLRDNGHMLHSAIARQYTGFGDDYKWNDNFQVAASVLFGLLHNHPFLDGNKRTALLSIVHLLNKHGYKFSISDIELENFIVDIAADNYKKRAMYQLVLDSGIPDVDVEYISTELYHSTDRVKASKADINLSFEKYLPSIERLADR